MQNPRNVGAHVKIMPAGTKLAIVAGSGTDNVEVVGPEIDREQNGHLAQSCQLAVLYDATLAEAETATLHVDIEDCDTTGGSYEADVEILASTVLATGAAGGSVLTDQVYLVNVDLSAYKRFVKFDITLDLSASGTDTATWKAGAALGGFDGLPHTA